MTVVNSKKELTDNAKLLQVKLVWNEIPAGKKEPTKDDEWPRYWLHDNMLYRENPNGTVDLYCSRKSSSYWTAITWRTWGVMPFGKKRLTPAEARARMEGKFNPKD